MKPKKYIFLPLFLAIVISSAFAEECSMAPDPIIISNSVDSAGNPSDPLSMRMGHPHLWLYSFDSENSASLFALKIYLSAFGFVEVPLAGNKNNGKQLVVARLSLHNKNSFHHEENLMFKLAHQFKNVNYDGWNFGIQFNQFSNHPYVEGYEMQECIK